MTDLLDLAVAAHGGLDSFNHFKTVSALTALLGTIIALPGVCLEGSDTSRCGKA